MKTSTKKVFYTFLEQDIRPIAGKAIGLILQRLQQNYPKSATDIEETFSSKNKEDIIDSIQNLVENLQATIEELEQSLVLISEIPDLDKSVKEDEEED
mgnify:CR=1 FL=1|tara:strand:- start:495 stop:788 length:294 start_codon:yes stop_codon:yes gene_type:complete